MNCIHVYMKLIDFLKSRQFYKHLLIAVVAIALFLFLIFKWLNIYTKHNETVTVPDLKGMPVNDAIALLEEQNFRYVIDSIYNERFPSGSVLEQDPDPNAKVKDNRTIYLTVISSVPPVIKLPDLIDVSFREASAIIESYGLKVGELIYKPDLAQNAVLGIQYQGKPVQKGFMLPKGSTVDLILGDGFGNLKVTIPNLVGLTYDEAVFVLQASRLMIGAIIFDGNSRDTLNARVYKQSPEFTTDTLRSRLSQGEAIDLYLKDN